MNYTSHFIYLTSAQKHGKTVAHLFIMGNGKKRSVNRILKSEEDLTRVYLELLCDAVDSIGRIISGIAVICEDEGVCSVGKGLLSEGEIPNRDLYMRLCASLMRIGIFSLSDVFYKNGALLDCEKRAAEIFVAVYDAHGHHCLSKDMSEAI